MRKQIRMITLLTFGGGQIFPDLPGSGRNCRNIVEHGFTGKKGKHFIDLRLALEKDGSGCLSLRDNGVKFNPLEYRNRDIQYGLAIIRGISEKIDYHYVASMNCLNVMIR